MKSVLPADSSLCRHITAALLAWYRAGHRDLPWRTEPSPYHVWLSEIMLQQTRVEAVRAYYTRFLSALPDIASLASAKEEALLKLWEGLGYYSRARNLKKAAVIIMERYGGQMPDTFEELKKLPGIGAYTAGAIASIAFHRRVPAVDGNVLRVMARLRGDRRDIAAEETKRSVFTELLAAYLPEDGGDCGDFNQALMELGALVCVPNGAPDCGRCPLEAACLAHRTGTESDLPVKSAKKPRRTEMRTVLLLCDRERILIRKRPAKGLLAGLYEYPSLDGALDEDALRRWLAKISLPALRLRALPAAKHIFTHIEWHMTGYLVYVETLPASVPDAGTASPETVSGLTAGTVPLAGPLTGCIAVSREEIETRYAIPSAFRAFTDVVKETLRGAQEEVPE